MYAHLLIPTDGSELSKKAAQHGIALAKAVNARVTVIAVSTPYSSFVVEPNTIMDSVDQYREVIAAQILKYLDEVRQVAEKADVNCELIHVEHEHPYLAIIEAAKSKKCDLIVMASHGRRGFSAILLGSETAKVLTHCNLPVLVYR